MFNRTQIGLSVFIAGTIFHSMVSSLTPWVPATGATVLALVASYAINGLLVALYTTARSQDPLGQVLTKLHVGKSISFLATYLGLGLLALVLARLFVDVGAWSVVAFLVPILVARAMLIRSQSLSEMAAQLKRREQLLQRLFDRAIDERRDERLTIAAELHDNILQSLTKMWMLGRLLREEIALDTQAGQDVEELIQLSDASIHELRQMMSEMRESPLGSGGLGSTLNLLVRDLRLEAGITIRLNCPNQLDLPPGIQLAVYQVAREALINAVKHARAETIAVVVTTQGEQVRLLVTDDGVGFDPGKPMSYLHFGLVLMSERARAAGGSLSVESAPGRGTKVSMTIRISGKGDDAPTAVGIERRTGLLPE